MALQETRHDPELLARYDIGELLGRGGMAIVYAVTDRQTSALGALKVVAATQPANHQLVRREGALLARLNENPHPGIVRLLDLLPGRPWFTLERLAPRSSENTSAETAVMQVRALAQALQRLEEAGVVHGDLSAANIMWRGPQPVLIDFGSAVEVGHSAREILSTTRGGASLRYASPERLRGEDIDIRSDLYSLGCLFFELCTGQSAFAADADDSLIKQQLGGEPRWSLTQHLPQRVVDLLRALLAKDRNQRPANATALLAAVDSADPQAVRALQPRALLVGRDRERADLSAFAQSVKAGEGATVLLLGESGIGKTRLLNDLVSVWSQAGFVVFGGRCLPPVDGSEQQGTALAPLLPALRQIADVLGDRDDLREAWATLAEALPFLGTVRETQSTPQQARRRILQALSVVLAASAGDAPVILIIDDLQWADELSLHFVCESRWPATRLLLIASCRSETQPQALREYIARGDAKVVALARLNADAVWTLARHLLGAVSMQPQLAEFLVQHSEGNPFFVTEYLHGAIARNGLSAQMPASIMALFDQRFSLLGDAEREALFQLAVLGRETQRARFAALHGEGNALRALRDHHIIDPGDDPIRFVHDKWREAALARIPVGQLRALHGQVAAMLERAGDDDDAALGWHWAQAQQNDRALPHLERAADRAKRSHLPKQAIVLLQLALQVSGDSGVRARIGEALGDALTDLARLEEARTAYDLALAREGHSPLVQARLYRKKAVSFATVHLFPEAHTALDAALTALGEPHSPEAHSEWIDIQLEVLSALYFSRSDRPKTDALLAALEIAMPLHGLARQMYRYEKEVFSQKAARQRFAFSAESHVYAERALASALAMNDPSVVPTARFAVAFDLRLPGSNHLKRAVALVSQTAREAEALSDITLLSRALTYWALCLRQQNDVSGCAALSERARKVSEEAGMVPYVGVALGCLAWVALRNNQLDLATKLVRDGQAQLQRSQHQLPFFWVTDLPELALVEDDFVRAAAIARRLLGPMQQRYEPELDACLQKLATVDTLDPRSASVIVGETIRVACQLAYL